VRAFPDGASRGDWKISMGGGQKARWSADGRTIYYQNADATALRSTRVTPGSPFGIGATETIMQGKPLGVAWDFDRATGRIAVTETVLDASVRIIVMQHWLDAFKRKLAATP
jgi:hypothetical protein